MASSNCSGLQKISHLLYDWAIDQVSSQDGWILVKFFFVCVFMDRDERGQCPTILTEKAWSIKDSGKCFLRDTASSPERAR